VRVDGSSVTLTPARRTDLDASAAFRAYTTRLAEGRARLGAPRRAARAAGSRPEPVKPDAPIRRLFAIRHSPPRCAPW
jgi:hypothetical protein